MRHAAKFMPPAPQRRYETNTNGLIQRFPNRNVAKLFHNYKFVKKSCAF